MWQRLNTNDSLDAYMLGEGFRSVFRYGGITYYYDSLMHKLRRIHPGNANYKEMACASKPFAPDEATLANNMERWFTHSKRVRKGELSPFQHAKANGSPILDRSSNMHPLPIFANLTTQQRALAKQRLDKQYGKDAFDELETYLQEQFSGKSPPLAARIIASMVIEVIEAARNDIADVLSLLAKVGSKSNKNSGDLLVDQ